MPGSVQEGDKRVVRDLTEDAISNAWSEARLRQLRAELADSLGVSRRSVGSVSAYVEYSATEAIADSGLAGRLKNADLITAARLLRGSGTPREDLDALAGTIGLDADDLACAVALYERYYQGRPDGELDSRTGGTSGGLPPSPAASDAIAEPSAPPPDRAPAAAVPARPQPPSLQELTPPSPFEWSLPEVEIPPASLGAELDIDTETGTRGDTANYDFPAKREWRSAWASYITNHYGPAWLRRAVVICLPGRAVEPEVSKYLAMGVRPENIHCVEDSARVREEFLANAARLGVRAYPMGLRDALERLGAEGVRFDVVNLDFHGPHSDAHIEALEALPLAADAILIYNALGKRETRTTKHRVLTVAAREEDEMASLRRFVEGQTAPAAKTLCRYLSEGASPADTSTLGTARANHVPTFAAMAAGARWNAPNRGLLDNVADTLGASQGSRDLAHLTDDELALTLGPAFHLYRGVAPLEVDLLVRGLECAFPSKLFAGSQAHHLGLVLWHSAFAVSYRVGGGEVYDYMSETSPGRPRSPFTTTMARLVQADSVLPQFGHVVRFASEFARQAYRRRVGAADVKDGPAAWLRVAGRGGEDRRFGTGLEWSDRLEVLEGGRVRAAVTAGDLRNALLEATALEKKHRLTM